MADGSGRVKFLWGDAEHTFRLPYKQLRELQDKTGIGPEELLNRLANGTWRADDIRETIRLGLIGGGMDPMPALVLVTRYVDDRPWLENKPVAFAIVAAILAQADGDPAGKAGRRGEAMAAAAESLSPDSSELPSQSDSPSKTSGTARRGNSRQQSRDTTDTSPVDKNNPSP